MYGGLEIPPQLGLVPLGRDPISGLWEFLHLRTHEGDLPERGDGGELALSEGIGIVLVLIPGGRFWMGSQAEDDAARNHDRRHESDESPLHEVELEPFFLSKFEMTQGQWQRFTGTNPSRYRADSYQEEWERSSRSPSQLRLGLHPVEKVSWDDCSRVMLRLDLLLPTEAQWEYAARAGSDSVWWAGNRISTLQGCGNLADAYAEANGAPSWDFETDLDDGHTFHAEVGRFRANPFGLHDMIGNVWEWCRDQGAPYERAFESGDGLRRDAGSGDRIRRGGCFNSGATWARSANRHYANPEYSRHTIGVRPSRALDLPAGVR